MSSSRLLGRFILSRVPSVVGDRLRFLTIWGGFVCMHAQFHGQNPSGSLDGRE